MKTCHEPGCNRPATCYVEVEAASGTPPTGLSGFTVPVCQEHAESIQKVIAEICEEVKEVTVKIVSPGQNSYGPTGP